MDRDATTCSFRSRWRPVVVAALVPITNVEEPLIQLCGAPHNWMSWASALLEGRGGAALRGGEHGERAGVGLTLVSRDGRHGLVLRAAEG